MINNHTQVLLIEDNPSDARLVREELAEADCTLTLECADRLSTGLNRLAEGGLDVVLLDLLLPDSHGLETFARACHQAPDVPIVVLTGSDDQTLATQAIGQGAQDYLVKGQVDSGSLAHAIRLAIGRKKADLVHSRHALMLALIKLVACRNSETGAHLLRLQHYCCCLAREAAYFPPFAGQIDARFIEMLECCAPLHDIGKIGLPDHIVLKPGKLTPAERILMQAHTTIGADTLKEITRRHGFTPAYLQMAIDIARHHHERYDGTGYPAQLAGNDIPLAARLVAIADVYDALRSRRVYKPALSHNATVHKMLRSFSGHLDPDLMQVFQRCHQEFERIFSELTD